jgi:SAM-dependent methyltransferase
MRESVTRKLGSGSTAEIREDRWRPGTFELVVDGTPQSHVDLGDPTELSFEYVRRMGHVIDKIGTPRAPITAVHLGAGALSIPRYVAHTRPGSRQQVIELDRDLVDLVREVLPWSKLDGIRVRYGDAREMLSRLPDALLGTCDLLVIDIFSGARIPAHVTSLEFYREAVRLLAPDGVVLVNAADGPPLRFARAQAATLAAALAPAEPSAADRSEVIALAETQVLRGRRFGNVVLAGSRGGIPSAWLPRLLSEGPHPAAVLARDDIMSWTSGSAVTTDADATASPEPGRGVFQFGGGS